MNRRNFAVGASAAIICAPGITQTAGFPSLNSEENWFATTLIQLKRIYHSRRAGRPRNNSFCVCAVGNLYVLLICEAVSPKSVSEVASILTPEGDRALRNMGFEAPGVSPNFGSAIGA